MTTIKPETIDRLKKIQEEILAASQAPEPITTYYRCVKCGEIDSDRGVNPPAPTSLKCCACKGEMFPVDEETARMQRQYNESEKKPQIVEGEGEDVEPS